MGVSIKVSGGEPVYRVTERYFPRTSEAQSYLREWGVTHDSLDGSNSDRCFKHRGFAFLLSHSLEAVLEADDDLPDNEMSRTVAENQRSFRSTRGSNGDEARKHAGNDAKPAAPGERPTPKPRSSSATTGDTVTLKDLCQELKLDPSKARQKLRKKFGATGARYEWSKEEAEKIKEVIR